MSVFRIVKRNLKRSRLINKDGVDLRPRNKEGILTGYCEKMAAERKKLGKSHVYVNPNP